MGHDISFQEIPSKDNLSVPVTIIFNPTQSIVLPLLQLLMKDPSSNNNRKYYCPFNTYLAANYNHISLTLPEAQQHNSKHTYSPCPLRNRVSFKRVLHIKCPSFFGPRIHLNQSLFPFNHSAECSWLDELVVRGCGRQTVVTHHPRHPSILDRTGLQIFGTVLTRLFTKQFKDQGWMDDWNAFKASEHKGRSEVFLPHFMRIYLQLIKEQELKYSLSQIGMKS